MNQLNLLSSFFLKTIFKIHSNKLKVVLIVGLIISYGTALQAQTLPPTITYQGKLVQEGLPFSGSTTMIFELVNPLTNTVDWTETQTINVQDGLYSVVLGTQNPFATNFFSQNPSLGLRVSVNGNALTSITVLQAVPYAHSANSVSDNSITSLKIINGTIQTIDLASGGQNKMLVTDANGQVVWVDRASATLTGTAGGDLEGTYPNPTIADAVITPTNISQAASPNNQVIVSDGSIGVVEWRDISTIVAETDPTVNMTNTNAVPRWNGTELIDSSITDDGSNVDIVLTGDLQIRADGDVFIESTSSVVQIGSSLSLDQDLIVANNATIGNDLEVSGVFDFNTNPFDEVITQSEVLSFSPSDAQIMTGVAITDYVASQLSGVSSYTAGAGIDISTNTISVLPINGLEIITDAGTDKIGLGGSLLQNTLIDGAAFDFRLANTDLIAFVSNDNINIDADNFLEISALNIGVEIEDEMIITLEDADANNAAFIIEDASANQILSLDRGSEGVNDFSLDMKTVVISGAIAQGGDINLKAQNFDDGNLFEAATFLLEGGSGDANRGGNAVLNGGNAPTGTKGAVFLQKDGGNIEVGDNTSLDSRLALNGWLELPSLPTLPAPTTNTLYNSGGNLFWGGIQLNSAASSYTFQDGLTESTGIVSLGGTLTNNVTIDGNTNDFSIINTDNFFIKDAASELFSIKKTNTDKFDLNINLGINNTGIMPNGGSINMKAQDFRTDVQGAELLLEGGDGDSPSRGGDVIIKGGEGLALNSNGGDIQIKGGVASASGSNGGDIDLAAGNGFTNGGNITIEAGTGATNGNVNIQPNTGNVYIGANVGNGKLNVRAEDNGNATANNALSVTGLDESSGSTSLEATSVEKAKAAFFVRTGNSATTNPVVLINENNDLATENTVRINGGEQNASALSINSTSITGAQRILTLQENTIDRFFVENNGNTNISGDLNVAGTTTNNAFPSDIRYKENITTLNNSLSSILSLRGTQYYWKNKEMRGERLQFGVIAQEVEEIFPTLVRTDDKGFKSVYYTDLIPVLIEATKEQQTIIDNQKEELKTQKTELENLKNQISELKEIVASLQENKNSNSALAQKVEALEKQLLALVDTLSDKTKNITQTASLKEEE